jgi:hypothetical protein
VKYTQKKFVVLVGAHKMTHLEYDLRVGKITQREYDGLVKKESK